MNRRKTRELTFKLVYESIIHKFDCDEVFENFIENEVAGKEDKFKDIDLKYLKKKLKDICEKNEELKGYISESSQKWKFERISKINVAILFVAIYEIKYEDDIPKAVSINEALELSKKYSEEKSKSFINGILDKID